MDGLRLWLNVVLMMYMLVSLILVWRGSRYWKSLSADSLTIRSIQFSFYGATIVKSWHRHTQNFEKRRFEKLFDSSSSQKDDFTIGNLRSQ